MQFTFPLVRPAVRAITAVAISVAFAGQVSAQDWIVDHAQSSLGFSVVNSGIEMVGQFTRWSADIDLDPDEIDDAEISVAVDLTSVSTGNGQADDTLVTADWFDAGAADTARFESETIRIQGESYVADGVLDLRGAEVPVSLVFDLVIDGESARAEGAVMLNRMDFGIGAGSDASGGMVGLEVPVRFVVVATKDD